VGDRPKLPDLALSAPEPPERLNEDESLLWREIVQAMGPDWFSAANLSLLEAYSHSIVVLRVLDARSRTALASLKKGETEAWDELTIIERCRTLAARESSTASNLATKMRLTQQARNSAERKPGQGTEGAPWRE
jgi:hypothetical protein